MFTWDSQNIIRLYGNKLLFLPDNRVIEGVETTMPLTSSVSDEKVFEKEEVRKTEIIASLEEVKIIEKPIVETKITPPVVEKVSIISTPVAKPYTLGEPVQWKMRPNVACKLIVIVSANEFKNAVLMGALLFIIEEKAKIPRTSVSFGVYQPGQSTWSLADMPAKIGVLFTDKEAENATIADKKVYVFPSMSTIALDIPSQEKCIALLKSFTN